MARESVEANRCWTADLLTCSQRAGATGEKHRGKHDLYQPYGLSPQAVDYLVDTASLDTWSYSRANEPVWND